jgi:hypothetical protein
MLRPFSGSHQQTETEFAREKIILLLQLLDLQSKLEKIHALVDCTLSLVPGAVPLFSLCSRLPFTMILLLMNISFHAILSPLP